MRKNKNVLRIVNPLLRVYPVHGHFGDVVRALNREHIMDHNIAPMQTINTFVNKVLIF